MSNFEKAGPRAPISSSPPRTWDFFETTLVALIAYGVFTLTGEYALAFTLGAYRSACALSSAEMQAVWLGYQERWQSVWYISGTLPGIAVLWVATEWPGENSLNIWR
jgi:uncharacterized protein